MPIEPGDLFGAAQQLNRMKPPLVSDEVCARTMLNRMYYAAYLATREAVRAQLKDPKFDVSHKALAKALMSSPDAEVKEVGSRLWALKDAREDADYQPHVAVSRTVASLHMAHARFVLDHVDRLTGRFPPIQRRESPLSRN